MQPPCILYSLWISFPHEKDANDNTCACFWVVQLLQREKELKAAHNLSLQKRWLWSTNYSELKGFQDTPYSFPGRQHPSIWSLHCLSPHFPPSAQSKIPSATGRAIYKSQSDTLTRWFNAEEQNNLHFGRWTVLIWKNNQNSRLS